MEDDTTLKEIGEEEFYAFLQHNPERLLQIMRQMSARIRENAVKYRDTCRRSFLISTGYLSISTMRKQSRTVLCAMDTEPCVSVKRMSIG
jgi:CRP-like cAMP-binding protein